MEGIAYGEGVGIVSQNELIYLIKLVKIDMSYDKGAMIEAKTNEELHDAEMKYNAKQKVKNKLATMWALKND